MPPPMPRASTLSSDDARHQHASVRIAEREERGRCAGMPALPGSVSRGEGSLRPSVLSFLQIVQAAAGKEENACSHACLPEACLRGAHTALQQKMVECSACRGAACALPLPLLFLLARRQPGKIPAAALPRRHAVRRCFCRAAAISPCPSFAASERRLMIASARRWRCCFTR